MQQHIAQVCDQQLGYLVSHFSTDHISLPLIPNTYSLWRSLAYYQLFPSRGQQDECGSSEMKLQFYLHSECKHLRQFLNILREYDCKSRVAVEKVLWEESNLSTELRLLYEREHFEGLTMYASLCFMQHIYGELLVDLVALPYISEVFPAKLTLRKEWEFKSNGLYLAQDTLMDHKLLKTAKSSVLKNGVMKAVEVMGAKAMLIPTLLGGINPLMLGASLGVSEGVKLLEQRGEESKALEKLKEARDVAERRVGWMETAFQQIISLIGKYLEARIKGIHIKELREEIQIKISPFMQKEWLHVRVERDDDGWETVIQEETEAQGSEDGYYQRI